MAAGARLRPGPGETMENVADHATPGAATAPEVATIVNNLIAELIAAGYMKSS